MEEADGQGERAERRGEERGGKDVGATGYPAAIRAGSGRGIEAGARARRRANGDEGADLYVSAIENVGR